MVLPVRKLQYHPKKQKVNYTVKGVRYRTVTTIKRRKPMPSKVKPVFIILNLWDKEPSGEVYNEKTVYCRT